MRKSSLVLAVAIIAVLTCSAAFAETWNSFTPATFTGIDVEVTVNWLTNMFNHNVTLNPGATVTVGGSAYQIAWLSGYYINTTAKTDGFQAYDALGSNVWKWIEGPNQGPPFNNVGWKCSGNANRLHANVGGQMTYNLTSPDIGTVQTVVGFHVGYYIDNNSIKTEFLSGPEIHLVDVPEPSALYGGLALLSGMATLVGRRKRTIR